MDKPTPSIKEYASQIAATLNLAGVQASRLSVPAGATERERVAWALLRLAFDHAAAISSLFYHHEGELAGPAFALLRPMNEALRRGTWIAFCASDAAVQKFIDDDELPPGKSMVADIEKIEPFDKFPMFSQQYANAWDKFHSFTHAGIQMVGAYTMGHGIGAAFPEENIRDVLDHAEAVAMLVVQVLVMIAGDHDPDLAHDVLDQLNKIEKARDRLANRGCNVGKIGARGKGNG